MRLKLTSKTKFIQCQKFCCRITQGIKLGLTYFAKISAGHKIVTSTSLNTRIAWQWVRPELMGTRLVNFKMD